MHQKILITSALPYANGPLHFGHIAGAYLPADCYARFQRLKGSEVLYICGSDEYGVAITLSAEMAGRTPQEHVNLFHQINANFFNKLNISFDHYSRTTWEGHVETTHQYFNDLLANGYIEARVTDQLYSEADRRFLADRYVQGTCPRCGFENARGDECPQCGASYDATELKNPCSKLTGAPLIRRPTEHWFLLLEKFKERLNTWLENKDWKPNVINFIKGYINDLHARSITRDSDWGVAVPLSEAEGKVLYVWFDAPIGYISATKEWAQKIGSPDRWQEYWLDPKVKLVNFIGKDNIPFHASIFPAMTMGQNQPYKLVDELPANEFFKLEGRQFSKSEGWYIDLEDFFSRYNSDQIRYVIAANAPETADSEFTWNDFKQRCNQDLLGKYGNLVNRVLTFIWNRCEGHIPALGSLEPIDIEFLKNIQDLVDQAAVSYETFKVRRASQLIMELAQQGNIYFDHKHPWQDIKQEQTKARMQTTLACCIRCLKALALISFPIIPTTANQLWKMLGNGGDLTDFKWDQIKEEKVLQPQKIAQPFILFQRIEDEVIEQEIQKLHQLAAQHKPTTPPEISKLETLKPLIEIDEFRKLDIRVGIITQAEPISKSKKLMKLLVNIGMETRTIVAGIQETYGIDQLIGRKVIVVVNLKPATLMGIQSEGMLLAAKDGKQLELISIQDALLGSVVS